MKGLLLAGILALTVLVYADSLHGEFQFDDAAITQWNAGQLGAYVQREMGIGHRPLAMLTYKLNFKWGKTSLGFHLVNLAIHLVSVSLVFFIALALLESLEGAAFGATVFACHPFFADSVNYIYARGSMMAAMFVFGACWAALTMKSRWKWPAVAVLVGLGALCKEEALIAPALFLAYAVIHRQWKLAGAMCALGISSLIVIPIVAPQMGTPWNTTFVNPAPDLVLNYGLGPILTDHWQVVVNGYVFHVLKNLALPFWLTADPQFISGGYRWILSMVAILVLAGLCLLSFLPRGLRYGIAGILCCPILGALYILVAEPLFEYRAYSMGLGVALLTGWTFSWAFKRFRVPNWASMTFRHSRWVPIVTGALVLVLCLGTIQRNAMWRDPIALWEDVYHKDPLKKRAVLNLSLSYLRNNRDEESERILLDSIHEFPGFRAAHVNLAGLYIKNRRCDAAEYHARFGIPVAIAYSYIGLCQIERNDAEEAVKNAEIAIRMDPTSEFSRSVRLKALEKMGKLPVELTRLEAEVELKPKDPAIHTTLAIAYRMVNAAELADREMKLAASLK